jgi:UDP-2-acetamido-3-amino-2,3-dideoxy-glucuronate N-acetyltransferase
VGPERPAAFVHATAVVDAGAVVEPGAKVWHFCHVSEGASVGEGAILGQNVFVGRGVRVGRGCKVQNNVSIYEGVRLEDEAFVGPSAVFTNVRHPRAHVSRRHAFEETVVGRRASIGANATVVCGVRIGEGAFVGAGAVVTKDVPPYALVVGVPARVVGHACACGERLPRAASGARKTRRCAACGAAYARGKGGGLAPTGARDGGTGRRARARGPGSRR